MDVSYTDKIYVFLRTRVLSLKRFSTNSTVVNIRCQPEMRRGSINSRGNSAILSPPQTNIHKLRTTEIVTGLRGALQGVSVSFLKRLSVLSRGLITESVPFLNL